MARDVQCFRYASLALAALAALASGCVSFDAEKARAAQTDDFTNRLAQASAELLSRPLSLGDCVAIAMTNNYEVRKTDLDKELARLGRKASFSAFLPQVSAAAGYNIYQKDPQVSSKKFDTEELSVGLPLFMPSTWFLYAAAKHGYAMGEIAAHYTRQSIALKVIDGYCDLIVQQDTVKALEAQLKATSENAERVRGLSKEGLVAAWEGEQAGYLEDARRVQLNQARRQLSVLKARFLADLGLAPAKFELSGDISFGDGILPVADDVRLDDLVLGALERHPLLSMADRQVVMKENAVRQAFCDFLPTLAGFGKETWSGNEVMTVTPNLVYGFNAAWKLFDGTAIAKYKSEKVEREKTSLERENTFLSVIVNVAAAEAAWRDAGEGAAISRRAFEVAKAKFLDYDARSREGLVPLGDALDARAAMDLAEVDFVKGKYRELCAKAALAFAAGTLPAPEAAGQ